VSLIASKHNVIPSFYADDSQSYTHFNPKSNDSFIQAVSRIEKCCAYIKDWMNVNLLTLNQEKTELLLIGSKHHMQIMKNVNSIKISGHKTEI
jgi:hypothetical protein